MAAMRNQRIAAVFLLLVGAGLLFAGLSGLPDDWFTSDALCGATLDDHACAPSHANGIVNLVGGILIAVAVLLFVLSCVLEKHLANPLETSVDPASIPVWNAPATPPAAPAAQASLADSLTRLAALRDRGAITDGEFQAQKAKLLG